MGLIDCGDSNAGGSVWQTRKIRSMASCPEATGINTLGVTPVWRTVWTSTGNTERFADLSDTTFRIFESMAVAGSGVLALLLGLNFVDFSRRLGQFGIR